MNKATVRRGAVALATIAAFALFQWLTAVGAQSSQTVQQQQPPAQPQPAAQPQEKTAEQTHKNIQSLKGLPDSQLIPVMNMFNAALGVRCDFCHVKVGEEWAWDKDDKKAKQTSRKMIEMTININKATFNGKPEVSCYTCHLGHEHPSSVPALPVPLPPKEEARRRNEEWPTAQQIVEKYVTAAGGKDAASRLKTRAIKGAYVNAEGNSLSVEMWFEAPARLLVAIKTPQGEFALALNQETGWISNNGKQKEMDAGELVRIRSLALSLDALQLKEPYPRLTFGGKEKIGEREAWVLRMITPDKKRVRLSFDIVTGLLLRRYTLSDTPVGPDPEQIDFEDYRDVDGVKVPFTVRVSYTGQQISALFRFAEVKHNVAVDPARFNMSK